MPDGLNVLTALQAQLSWPSPDDVVSPTGAGAAVLVRLAQDKIEARLRRMDGVAGVTVGILVPDRASPDTPEPIAIICEFSRPVSAGVLAEAHRLAWNFCRAPLLITLEPDQLRAWSCLTAPAEAGSGFDLGDAEITEVQGALSAGALLGDRAAEALQWVSLASGEFIRRRSAKFKPEGRADRMLLENLRLLRAQLVNRGELDEALAHDLIGRLVFIQFLFDRKDASGESALNAGKLADLHRGGLLGAAYEDLTSLLQDHADTYGLFRWLDSRFNGDFFPGKGATSEEREAEWTAEMQVVLPAHLASLSDFVGGKISGGQYSFWRSYEFDVIPLEFVSCIYEEFLRGDGGAGVHYTPVHLVDFVLDSVLPWDGAEWDLRILDPSCGSGTFLVRCFQRLVNRWRLSNEARQVPPSVLVGMLEHNFLGIEINPLAARVTSFSLYLAMFDEIDPRDYWTEVRFPILRDRRILSTSFFDEATPGIRTSNPEDRYDIIVGNPPWSARSALKDATDWAKENGWPVANRDFGTLFLAKAASLARPRACVAMLQPASQLLLNRSPTAQAFRKRLFDEYRIEEIVNLSVLRFKLFASAASPACSVTLRNELPEGRSISYICPKLLHTGEDTFRIAYDPQDSHDVLPWEAVDPWVWTVLAAGGRRDLALLRRLRAAAPSLSDHCSTGSLTMSEGIIPGSGGTAPPHLRDRRYLASPDFPPGTILTLDSGKIPRAAEIRAERPRAAGAFEMPQVLVKQAWRPEDGRFRAALVVGGDEGIVCNQSFLTVHAEPTASPGLLESACLMANSRLAAYFLTMSSGRTMYRPEVLVDDFRQLPIIHAEPRHVSGFSNHGEVDDYINAAFALNDVEMALVEDGLNYGIPELVRDPDGPGRQETISEKSAGDALETYCGYFLRVLAASSGGDCLAGATVFRPTSRGDPVRLAAIHLDVVPASAGVQHHELHGGPLQERIRELERVLGPAGGSLSGRRVATIYDTPLVAGRKVATAYLVKPNQMRYWTRSAALRDADAMVAAGLLWQAPDRGVGQPLEAA